MSFSVAEFGGLAVAFSPVDRKVIERELSRLDKHLFLDPEVEPYGPRGPYVYMTVKHWVGSNHPPVAVLEWRDESGPRPLSMAIVEHVKRKEGAIDGAFAAALRANEEKKQRVVEEVGEYVYEIAMDAKKAQGKSSANLPRSQSLRQARDRARARGRNV